MISGYLFVLMLVLLLNGWFVDCIGVKVLYLWCFLVFMFMLVLCGFVWFVLLLIVFCVL